MNQELPAVQAEFRKGRGTRDQIANIWHRWLIEKAREFQKNIYFFFIDYAKPLTVCITTNCPKIFQAMGIPEHLTCLLRNLCAGQEAVVRTGHGTTDWFKIGKGVCQGYILSPYLFNLYAEYLMRNARLHESQAGIKTAERNISNLKYADDATLMAEGWPLKNWCLWIWIVLKKILNSPWTAERSNQSILKEINPEYSLEGLMMKLKPQYFGQLMQRANFC